MSKPAIISYLERMTELEPNLSPNDRASLDEFYRTRELGVRDSDWPGWRKHLGPRPEPRQLRIVGFPKARAI